MKQKIPGIYNLAYFSVVYYCGEENSINKVNFSCVEDLTSIFAVLQKSTVKAVERLRTLISLSDFFM